MALLAIDIGATKLCMGIFDEQGKLLVKEKFFRDGRQGKEAGDSIVARFKEWSQKQEYGTLRATGVCVPGIYRIRTGTVWAPNIPGWEDYPLLEALNAVSDGIPVSIDSDRACYILGETWQGNTKNCNDAIYLAVGTGIGAGIITEGRVLRGAHDIAGAIGWLALKPPFTEKYCQCGCFEEYASGEGLLKTALEILDEDKTIVSELRKISREKLTTADIFNALNKKDGVAVQAIQTGITYWGMAAANLVSLFNPEKIIFGGGVFGPAIPLIPQIREEATKWAQPISMQQVQFESSALGTDAGLYGAAHLALKNLHP